MKTLQQLTSTHRHGVPAMVGMLLMLGLSGLTGWAADPPNGDDGNQIDCAYSVPLPNPPDHDDPPVAILGDADADGVVSFQDIECFVAALFGEEIWRACTDTRGLDYYEINDINGDGIVDFNDVEAFIALLLSQL